MGFEEDRYSRWPASPPLHNGQVQAVGVPVAVEVVAERLVFVVFPPDAADPRA